MAQERVRQGKTKKAPAKKEAPAKAETTEEAKAKVAALKAELDELLDEIDEVLEENESAASFVANFIQKGGQ